MSEPSLTAPGGLPLLDRLARLALAAALVALSALLAAPLAQRVSAAATAATFLVEFLTDGDRPWLTRLTRRPRRVDRALPDGRAADLWVPGRLPPHRGLVLVHGLTPAGRLDFRVRAAAGRLARGGFATLVPDLPALRAQRLRPEDAATIRDAVATLAAEPGVDGRRIAMLAVSVGLGPTALALAEPATARRVSTVVSLGGYAEARELIRYHTTGAYAFGAIAGQVPVDPGRVRDFARLNLDLVETAGDRAAVAATLAGHPVPVAPGPEGRAVLELLDNRDPRRVDALLAALPGPTGALLDALSPARHLARWPGRLLLVHGRDDPAVPFTESLRLRAAAVPGQARLALVGLLAHVEGRDAGGAGLFDLVRLWTVAYELFRGAD